MIDALDFLKNYWTLIAAVIAFMVWLARTFIKKPILSLHTALVKVSDGLAAIDKRMIETETLLESHTQQDATQFGDIKDQLAELRGAGARRGGRGRRRGGFQT